MRCRREQEPTRRSFALILIIATLLCLPGSLPAAAKVHHKASTGAKAKPDLSDQFFTNGPVPFLKIEIKGTNLTALERNDRAYARATLRDGETVYKDIAIHLKGAAGSRRDLHDRPALTINFDRFQDHQKFHGLEKIHLNNSVQDQSYMTELLCGELFRAAGVPAARTTHARVELNGRDLGLYVLKEGFNKAFLRRYFKNAEGNLFDGGFLTEISEPLQRMSGKEPNPYAPLKAVVAAAEEPDQVKRMERLERVLDLDRFISFIAMEVMTWHWDGYAMKKNNYRVYHDPDTGKVVFFAHGMDQMFWEPTGPILLPLDRVEGLVARSVLETADGRQRYRARMASLLTNVFKVDVLTNRMNEVQARIRPVLAAINPSAAREHDDVVNNLRHQIVRRAAFMAQKLMLPEPKIVRFDSSGLATLSDWQQEDRSGTAALDKVAQDGKQILHIGAGPDGHCTASWRSRVLLEVGRYRFEGLVRTAGVVPLGDQRGEGAGLRMSQSPRSNKASGDTPWTKLEYNFTVPTETSEVDLVCELRAIKGEAWFDVGSLQLVRKSR